MPFIGNFPAATQTVDLKWDTGIKTSSFTAEAGRGYWINTTSGAVTVTLPASANAGDTIEFSDYSRKWGTNAVTLNQNSLNFQGNTSPNPIYNTDGQSVKIVYSGATQGWIPSVDDDVTMETPQTVTTDFLVIAGGGGGGSGNYAVGGGGAGAGGYRNSYGSESSGGGSLSETALQLTPGITYTITVGAGGSGSTNNSDNGSNGTNSSIVGSDITDIISIGGGRGGNDTNENGDTGGSGGGCYGNGNGAGLVGSPGTANQGYKGGNATSGVTTRTSGGGGGASAVGVDAAASVAGNGGAGLSSAITGSNIARGGGGGGGCINYGGTKTPGSGGTGGGGNGGNSDNDGSNPIAPTTGAANTGGGAGGASGNGNYQGRTSTGVSGGSGVVILRMPTSRYSGASTSGSPSVSTSGSDTIIVFNASGSITL